MIINNNLNQHKNSISSNGVIRYNNKNNKEQIATKNLSKFDTFKDNNINETSENTINLKLINKLKDMSDDEIKETIAYEYATMERIILSKIGDEYNSQQNLKEYQEQRGYYEQLVQNGYKITYGKYIYKDKTENDFVDKNEVLNILEKINLKIDTLLNPKKHLIGTELEMQDLSRRVYNSSASTFSVLTGYKSEALNIDNDTALLPYHDTRTEENFIEESNKVIKSLKQRSLALTGLMNKYMEEQKYSISNTVKNSYTRNTLMFIEQMKNKFKIY